MCPSRTNKGVNMKQWEVTNVHGFDVVEGDTVYRNDHSGVYQGVVWCLGAGSLTRIIVDGQQCLPSEYGLTVSPVQYERTHVTEVRGPYDVNGNSRLGYIVVGWRGSHCSKFINAGAYGFQAVRDALGDPSGGNLGEIITCQVTTTTRGFKSLLDLGRDLI